MVHLGSLQIIEQRCSDGVLDRGFTGIHNCGVAIPQHLVGNHQNLGQVIPDNACFKGQEYEYKADHGYHLIALKAPIDKVLAYAEAMHRPLPPDHLISNGVLQLNCMALHQLQRYLKTLIDAARGQSSPDLSLQSPITVGSLRTSFIVNDVLSLLVDAFTAEPNHFLPETSSRQRHLVKRADALMREHLQHPPTLKELCQQLGRSSRSLSSAFREVYGLPPMTYFKTLRLQGVRQTLKTVDPMTTCVTDIATDWGFLHMGQFSQDYKRMFGESPSSTLKRVGQEQRMKHREPYGSNLVIHL
jgi:AraC family ethanolamine operon transcriptional activator